MALIDTQTFALAKRWLVTALTLIPSQPDVFTAARMREARVAFICGKNQRDAIRGWLLAAQIIDGDKGQYFLTDYGKRLKSNDENMAKAASWWSLHLSICFSDRGDPYRALFIVAGENAGYVYNDDALISKLAAIGELDCASDTLKSNLAGVVNFLDKTPISDLGLIAVANKQAGFRMGEPSVPDQCVIHALALARHRHFPSRETIAFSELVEVGFHHFLCLSVTDLRNRLRELSRSLAWQKHFAFLEGKNLDSIRFGDELNPHRTIFDLLQKSEDTWL